MAAVDYFLKLDGIEGESTDDRHRNEIDVESWSWGATNARGGRPTGGAAAGKVTMQDFQFVTRVSKASPALMQACATGQHIKTATLAARKAGESQQDYLTFKLQDVTVSSYQSGGAADSGLVPTDQISLSFARIEVEYRPQKPDGSLDAGARFGFDLGANTLL